MSKTPETIDVEATTNAEAGPDRGGTTLALERRGEAGVGRALTIEELHERLKFIRDVMKKEMVEDVDYGKIPGCGDKPGLFQPGAQKLLMTFNLRAQVQREVKTDFTQVGGVFGHREYEFTVRIFPSGGDPVRDGTDGVGTCSTLESKYRYRKAERRCPNCQKTAIIAENPEFCPPGQVPGFLCWKKKQGCGMKFHAQHPDIISQPAGDVENEDPADGWNTVRKMGFKRALVAGVINFTNTSELWSQDLEDIASNARAKEKPSQTSQKPAAATSRPPEAQTQQGKPAAQQAPPANQQSKPATQPKFPTDVSRTWLIGKLKDRRRTAEEYFCKLENPAVLMPGEHLEDLPLEFLPLNKGQYELLVKKLDAFEAGGPPEHAFPAHPLPDEEQKKRSAKKATGTKAPPPATATPEPARPVKERDPEWFFAIICPIPVRGMKKAEYMKKPDTILSLYHKMKAGDDAAQKRLWGFAKHWEPQPFKSDSGKTYPITDADKLFREALDAFVEWEEKHGKDTAQPELPTSQNDDQGAGEAAAEAESMSDRERELAAQAADDVPI